ncbi:hypothetical protein KBC54_03435 [Patescibacteria group bacterium]|nr:hypothetical protein [Patescibacteria group bacterium]
MNNPFAKERFKNLPEEGLTEVYQNPHIKLPFDLRDLVLFSNREHGDVPLRALPYHHRSADLGISTIIHEKDRKRHHVFCQFDIKGGGFLFPEQHESKKVGVQAGELAGYPEAHLYPNSPETPWGYDALGLMDERMANGAIQRAEQLSVLGMRVEGIAAVFRTDRIMVRGVEVPVTEFKREAIERMRQLAKDESDPDEKQRYREMVKDIKEMFEPVIMIRLMRSIFRLRDLKDATSEQRQQMLKEACQNVNYEQEALGLPERLSVETSEGMMKFIEFISEWYGRNIGMLHGGGFTHEFLHMGNLTLAGEIVDLDSVQPVVKQVKYYGKPENKSAWNTEHALEPFFHETPEGGAWINPDVGMHRQPDERFTLPKCLVKDMRDICFSLRMICKEDAIPLNIRKQEIRQSIAEALIAGYIAGLSESDSFEVIGISSTQLVAAFREIAGQVVRDAKRMPSVAPDEV